MGAADRGGGGGLERWADGAGKGGRRSGSKHEGRGGRIFASGRQHHLVHRRLLQHRFRQALVAVVKDVELSEVPREAIITTMSLPSPIITTINATTNFVYPAHPPTNSTTQPHPPFSLPLPRYFSPQPQTYLNTGACRRRWPAILTTHSQGRVGGCFVDSWHHTSSNQYQ